MVFNMNYEHDFPVWYVLYLVEDGDGDMDRESRPEAVSSSLLTLYPHPKTISRCWVVLATLHSQDQYTT